jgi:hypothetical protein
MLPCMREMTAVRSRSCAKSICLREPCQSDVRSRSSCPCEPCTLCDGKAILLFMTQGTTAWLATAFTGDTAFAAVRASIMTVQNASTSIFSATVALGGSLRPRMLIKSTTVCRKRARNFTGSEIEAVHRIHLASTQRACCLNIHVTRLWIDRGSTPHHHLYDTLTLTVNNSG